MKLVDAGVIIELVDSEVTNVLRSLVAHKALTDKQATPGSPTHPKSPARSNCSDAIELGDGRLLS